MTPITRFVFVLLFFGALVLGLVHLSGNARTQSTGVDEIECWQLYDTGARTSIYRAKITNYWYEVRDHGATLIVEEETGKRVERLIDTNIMCVVYLGIKEKE